MRVLILFILGAQTARAQTYYLVTSGASCVAAAPDAL